MRPAPGCPQAGAMLVGAERVHEQFGALFVRGRGPKLPLRQGLQGRPRYIMSQGQT